MEKLLVHINIDGGEWESSYHEDRPILYPALIDALTDLELLYIYHADAIRIMKDEIDRMSLHIEKNEGRWDVATYREKRMELSTKEDEMDVYKKLTFGGNDFKIDELGYFSDLQKTWVFNSNISELNEWFDSTYARKNNNSR